MAEQNPDVDEKGEEKIGTESPPESMSKETKLELVENEGDSEEEDLSAILSAASRPTVPSLFSATRLQVWAPPDWAPGRTVPHQKSGPS